MHRVPTPISYCSNRTCSACLLPAARFASLLRYLAQWRMPGRDSSGYDAIVIVAHSPGIAITTDLLRFLVKEAGPSVRDDPALSPILEKCIPIDFFTMASPLRQPYSQRFRTFIVERGDNSPDNTRIPATQRPDPKAAGVRRWVNAFRSGDYVGRYLWRTDEDASRWNLASSADDAATRKEFCIGAGAHTHYWDKNGPQIAAQLDELISTA